MRVKKLPKISRKKLLAHLGSTYGIPQSKVAFEAYDSQVSAYVYLDSLESRAKLEAELPAAGFQVNRGYSPGSPTVEVTNISFFKAEGWNA